MAIIKDGWPKDSDEDLLKMLEKTRLLSYLKGQHLYEADLTEFKEIKNHFYQKLKSLYDVTLEELEKVSPSPEQIIHDHKMIMDEILDDLCNRIALSKTLDYEAFKYIKLHLKPGGESTQGSSRKGPNLKLVK